MKVEDVITLDNDAKYLLLEEIEYKENKYFFAIGVYDNQEFDYSDYLFFLAGEDEEGEYVEKVENNVVYRDLLTILVADQATEDDETLRETLLQDLEKIEKDLG